MSTQRSVHAARGSCWLSSPFDGWDPVKPASRVPGAQRPAPHSQGAMSGKARGPLGRSTSAVGYSAGGQQPMPRRAPSRRSPEEDAQRPEGALRDTRSTGQTPQVHALTGPFETPNVLKGTFETSSHPRINQQRRSTLPRVLSGHGRALRARPGGGGAARSAGPAKPGLSREAGPSREAGFAYRTNKPPRQGSVVAADTPRAGRQPCPSSVVVAFSRVGGNYLSAS
jgi:hypothetical protein